jgi:hypothetical protein
MNWPVPYFERRSFNATASLTTRGNHFNALINRSQTAMSATSYTKSRFSASDAALVMIDHQ